MDKLITTLAPVFAAGFAVQQLLEILTSFLDLDARPKFQKYKKAILGAIALAAGIVLAFEAHLRVLKPLLDVAVVQNPAEISVYLDYVATGLVISAGTEGINSILKFLKYKKEDVKNDAATKTSAIPDATRAAVASLTSMPSASALIEINRK